jgi:hypothetical protein
MVSMKTVEAYLRDAGDTDLEHVIKMARELLQFRKRLRSQDEKLRGIKKQ